MTPRLITLEAWATQVYGDAAPGIDTLRRWARTPCISPRPEKHGRTYMVSPDARYAPATHRTRLIERIPNRVASAQKRA